MKDLKRQPPEAVLEYLLRSEVVRLVYDGKFTAKGLDRQYNGLTKRIRELEYTRAMDMSEIVKLRRQIELYEEGKA